MKKFFANYNNGVTAIVSEEVYNDIHRQRMIRQQFVAREESVEYKDRWRADLASKATEHLTVPIFTFASDDRFEESPWFTGNRQVYKTLVEYIRKNGGVVEEGGFFVPFSNGCEIGMHSKDAMKSELAYVTTSQQFRETFGISQAELVNPTDTNLNEAFSEMVRGARRM